MRGRSSWFSAGLGSGKSWRPVALLTVGAALLGGAALTPEARAFCGFFVSGADAPISNNASQVVLLRKGNRTVMSMSNNYKGPPEDFAMVVPVPVVLQKEQVKTLAPDVFKRVDQLSAPRLVEYWEQDPCYVSPPFNGPGAMAYMSAGGAVPDEADGAADRLGVKIEAKFEVGEYQILILSAKESGGLESWLRLNKYNIPKGAAAALAPYIRDQMKFFVAKVNIKKVSRDSHGLVVLSPLRFSFDAAELRLPVRLGLLNADGKQDLLVYILHPEKRFEVANYRNLFIPTNIEVANEVRKTFSGFYAELFDETLRRNNGSGVVTEYAWQTTSCDPCPTPPLEASDLYTLGDDSFAGNAPKSGPGSPGPARPIAPTPYYGSPPSYVLTRLHTRYDQKTLSDDLIFREAPPVVGGRANSQGGLGDQGAQVEKAGVNNFQGRYIIRHYWEGKVACKAPNYGVWGGPPSSGYNASGSGAVNPAQDLANAPRGKVSLPAVVTSGLPEFAIPRPQARAAAGGAAVASSPARRLLRYHESAVL